MRWETDGHQYKGAYTSFKSQSFINHK